MIWNVATTLAATLVLLMGGEAVAQGETPPATDMPAAEAGQMPAPPLWLMSCSNQANPEELLCEFSQSLVVAQGNQRLATASFSRVAGQGATEAIMSVPVGVALAEGVAVKVDTREVARLAYDSCDGQGCHATGPVEDGWLQAMRAGNQLTLTVKGRDGADIDLNFQLSGFSKAEAMLP